MGPCFLSYSKRQGARTTDYVEVWVQESWFRSISIYK